MFWVTYTVTCALLHHLLSQHYWDACRPGFFFGLDSSAYCTLVAKTVHVLRASPLAVALAHVPRALPLVPA